jgi:hypothetical protein
VGKGKDLLLFATPPAGLVFIPEAIHVAFARDFKKNIE